MDAIQLCPVCQGPVPADAATPNGLMADCPSCGTLLIRAPGGQQDPGWQELGSSTD